MKHTLESKKELNLNESHTASSSISHDLIIIGAGPSGLFCAVNSRPDKRKDRQNTADKKILVLERKSSPARKLLISGSGQCNITHEGEPEAFLDHYGDHGRFLRPAILGFTNKDLISYFERRGLAMISEPGGKIFPQTRKARDVLDILIEECRRSDIEIKCSQEVRIVARTEEGFQIICKGSEYRSSQLVIATGGCSYPATGSTGDGYRIARALGHSLTEIGPALTPLIIGDYPFADLAGISLPDMKISLYHNQKKTRQNKGDVLFTHEGLSGPAVLDLSRHIRAGDTLKLSFVPEEERRALEMRLVDRSPQEGRCSIKAALYSLPFSVPLPARLISRILEMSGIDSNLSISQLKKDRRLCLINNLTGLPQLVSGLGGFDVAMVTRGGVDWREVDPKTMHSRRVAGLYLAGEVLDVDGDTGGYNLQSCFSTGVLAAKSIKKIWETQYGMKIG